MKPAESWTRTVVGDVCQVVGGATPNTGVSEYWGEDIPWITPDDLSGYSQKYISSGRRSLTRNGYASCSASMLPAGSVLFSSRAPIGYVAIAAGPVCTNQGFKSLIPSDVLLSDYLYWYMKWATPRLQERGTGTTFREVSKRVVATFPIAFPLIEEQRRIVATIEGHFSQLDAVDKSLSEADSKTMRLRRAFVASLIDHDWPMVMVKDIVTSVRNGVFVSRPAVENIGARIFRISAVRPMRLDVDDVRYIPEGLSAVDAYFVSPGDLLFTRYNGNARFVGACAVVPEGIAPTVYPDKLIRVVPNRAKALPEFLSLYLNDGSGRLEIEKMLKTTAGQIGIAGSQIKAIPVRLPDLQTQRRVVRQFEVFDAACARQILAIKESSRLSSALRRKVLGRAFAGTETQC